MAATITAAAALVGAGVSYYNSKLQHEEAQRSINDANDLEDLNQKKADDILEQIGSEELLYQDDLEMVQKQTALAEDKLKMQTASAFEQTGDVLSDIVAGTYNAKYASGAGQRTAREARAAMKEESVDLLESFEMGQAEIGLQNEDAERQAEIRKDEIIGALESTYMELTGDDMPNIGVDSTIPTDPLEDEEYNESEDGG